VPIVDAHSPFVAKIPLEFPMGFFSYLVYVEKSAFSVLPSGSEEEYCGYTWIIVGKSGDRCG
jgi:hypothetical protein